MKNPRLLLLIAIFSIVKLSAQEIPLAEHPRPDFERTTWQNLNGAWDFAFDIDDEGLNNDWAKGEIAFPEKITVPFPWGSKLSGLTDDADIGWYHRSINVPTSWRPKRTFLTIGAADWETHIWLDGKLLGSHRGGYVPFSVELTEHLQYGKDQKLVIRVDDARREFTLYGKQGYGNARGIWQTVYLESRGTHFIDALHMIPDIDAQEVKVTVYLPQDAPKDLDFSFKILGNDAVPYQTQIPAGAHKHSFVFPVPYSHLWTLDDPFLYKVEAQLENDQVKSYLGMRKISVVNLPGTDHPYIALNNEPVYLQLALDQSYHPEGFYTFPSDQFMREEIERSKSIGLNGIRPHIKVEIPRKLFWADKLGLLVMADLPNSWGEPDKKMQAEASYTLKEMIKRDFNHPSIFSWVIFNETWGLRTKQLDENGKSYNAYLPETQNWVASMYYLAKSLDPSRLVEDNSICCGRGHTETDINSWHVYLPGYSWDEYLKNLTENTYEGSTHDFEVGFQQGKQPNINSECGNVWGYDGSAGDVDWSYDYHRMLNSFRMYPKIGGWLYTEHHDVINEWNGYWRFDRTEKKTGMGEMVKGMRLNDLHTAVYLSSGNEICQTGEGNEKVEVPLFLSVMTGENFGEQLKIVYTLETTNYIGETEKNLSAIRMVDYQPWMQKKLAPLELTLPDVAGLAILHFSVLDSAGKVLHRNFMHFEIISDKELANTKVLSVSPSKFSEKSVSEKAWSVREGRKVNFLKNGSVSYDFELPQNLKANRSKEAYFLIEVSAKEYFVKDQQAFDRNQDYMKGSVVAPSSNPNSYPMTDETMHPSTIRIYINDRLMTEKTLSDDPADHRGILSWHHQLQDKKLHEAGSYGYQVKVPLSRAQRRSLNKLEKVSVRIEFLDEGGLAVYGKEFGRYPYDPSLVFKY